MDRVHDEDVWPYSTPKKCTRLWGFQFASLQQPHGEPGSSQALGLLPLTSEVAGVIHARTALSMGTTLRSTPSEVNPGLGLTAQRLSPTSHAAGGPCLPQWNDASSSASLEEGEQTLRLGKTRYLEHTC